MSPDSSTTSRPRSLEPSRTIVKSIEVFMGSSQLCVATLTHYSTEPLTTGPDYDSLLLLLVLAGDVHPNPGSPRYPGSVCFKNVTSQGTSYLCTRYSHSVHQHVLIFEMLQIIVELMAGSVPPGGRHHSHAQLPHRIVLPTRPPCQTRRSTYHSGTPMVSATNRRRRTKSRSPNIQNYTLVRQDRHLGPGGGLPFDYP